MLTELKRICEPLCGDDIKDTIKEAIQIAKDFNTEVNFSFNGVDMQIFYYSDFNAKCLEYTRRLQQSATKIVKAKALQCYRDIPYIYDLAILLNWNGAKQKL